MAKKYYAVKKGRKTGVFETWDECKQSVSGYNQRRGFGFCKRYKE